MLNNLAKNAILFSKYPSYFYVRIFASVLTKQESKSEESKKNSKLLIKLVKYPTEFLHSYYCNVLKQQGTLK